MKPPKNPKPKPYLLRDFMTPEEIERAGDRAADVPASHGMKFLGLKFSEGADLSGQTAQPVVTASLNFNEWKMGKGPRAAAEKRSLAASKRHEAWREFARKTWREQAEDGRGTLSTKEQMAKKIKAARIEGATDASLRVIRDSLKGIKARIQAER